MIETQLNYFFRYILLRNLFGWFIAIYCDSLDDVGYCYVVFKLFKR